MKVRKINRIGFDKKKRVAAYCRVSTNSTEQEESYERQMEYYTRLIRSKPEWEFAGIYADQGRSGTRIKGRIHFQRMIRDALGEEGRPGTIDLILVKSISRFSRNVVDCQRIVMQLKTAGVEVRFEKEGISSFDASAGFIFSILSAVAQDESRSISENVRWSYVNRFRNQIYNIGSNRIFGYTSVNGKLVPDENAPVVKEIFEMYVAGIGLAEITKKLNLQGIHRLRSEKPVTNSMVYGILKNETYVGDKQLQKQPPLDFLTKRPDQNKEYSTYYLKDDHEGIIDRYTWEEAQKRLSQTQLDHEEGIFKRSSQHPLYGKLFCGNCGAPYKRRTLHKNSDHGGQYKAWNCKERQLGTKGNGCKNRVVREESLIEEIKRATGTEVLEDHDYDRIERVYVYEDWLDIIIK